MIIGTTTFHKFKTPLEAKLVSKVEITYKQDDEIVLTKTESECNILDYMVTTELSQEETFKFDFDKLVRIQIRLLDVYNKVHSSYIFAITAAECLSDEVL